jgi:hypothetical protein
MTSVIGVLLVALTLPPSLARSARQTRDRASTFQERLQTRCAPLREADISAIQVLIHGIFAARIPFALEYVDRAAVTPRPRLRLPQQTLERRLESVVGMMPGFKVSFAGGLVDVYSPAARSDSSDLLNVLLPSFKVQGMDAGFANAAAFDALTVRELPGSGGALHSTGGIGGSRVTVDARSVPVYEVLNKIVSEQGHSLWVVGVPPDKLSKLSGNLWYFYGFDSVLEQTVIERLVNLFPGRH